MPELEFIAEIKETKQVKLVSQDNQYSLRLITDDSKILALGALPSDITVKVVVKYEVNNFKNKSESKGFPIHPDFNKEIKKRGI
jgi:hypothetical protein